MRQIKNSREIDELCETIIRQYEGEEYIEKPVDIAGLAVDHFKLKVLYVRFAAGKKEKLGCISNGTTMYKLIHNGEIRPYCFPKNTILLDISLKSEQNRSRRRFTLAHEVYHYIDNVINGNQSYGYHSKLTEGNEYSIEELSETMSIGEWAADRGAAALLMPKNLVYTTARAIIGDYCIPIFGSNIVLDNDKQKIAQMAKYLGVSYTAMFIRLKELRLFYYRSAKEYLKMTMEANAL